MLQTSVDSVKTWCEKSSVETECWRKCGFCEHLVRILEKWRFCKDLVRILKGFPKVWILSTPGAIFWKVFIRMRFESVDSVNTLWAFWKCGFCKDLVSLESVDSARTLYEFWGKCGFCEDPVRVFEPWKRYGFCQDLVRIRGSSRILALGGAWGRILCDSIRILAPGGESCATVLGFLHLGANPVRQY